VTTTAGVNVGDVAVPVATKRFKGDSYLYHYLTVHTDGFVRSGFVTLKFT